MPHASLRRTGMFNDMSGLDNLVDVQETSALNSQDPQLHCRPELITPIGVSLLSDNAAEKRRELEEQYQELLWQAEHIDEFGEDEDGFNFEHGGREGMEILIHLVLIQFLTWFTA